MIRKFNLIKYLSLNIFYYSLFSFGNGDFNITHWWLFKTFWGGVIFTLVELWFLLSCLDFDEKKDM